MRSWLTSGSDSSMMLSNSCSASITVISALSSFSHFSFCWGVGAREEAIVPYSRVFQVCCYIRATCTSFTVPQYIKSILSLICTSHNALPKSSPHCYIHQSQGTAAIYSLLSHQLSNVQLFKFQIIWCGQ